MPIRLQELSCRVCGAPLQSIDNIKKDEQGLRYFRCRYCGAINMIDVPLQLPKREVFGKMRFKLKFWTTQKVILDTITRLLKKGKTRFFIVSPPGSGKTIAAIEIIRMLGENALVLVPTTTILTQWIQRMDLFIDDTSKKKKLISDSKIAPITVMTYQSFSAVSSENELVEQLSRKKWIRDLMECGMAFYEAEEYIKKM